VKVNAKNGYGGYTDYIPYVFLFRDNKIIFEADGETELNSAEVAATKAWFFKTLKARTRLSTYTTNRPNFEESHFRAAFALLQKRNIP
jgi:hypothetical protein